MDAAIRSAIAAGLWDSRPLVWGESDCCQFVRACIQHIHGIDIMAGIPRYTTETEAQILLYPSLRDVVTRVLGKPVTTHEAGRPALVRYRDDEALGLTYSGGALCRSRSGLIRIPIGYTSCEWVV